WLPGPSRRGIECFLGQPREKAAQHRGSSGAHGSRQQAPSVERPWRLRVEGFMDTAADGIGCRSGSSLGQRLRRKAAAISGGCRKTELTQPASNGSYEARFAHLREIKVTQFLAPEAYLK